MKVAFIKVNMMYSKGKDALKPLVFSVIEECTPKEVDIVFYDERIEKLPEKPDADVIALSVETFAAKHAYELARKYKTNSNIIVMGGFHISACEEEALEYADAIIVGDAEETWPKLLEDIKNNDLKRKYISDNKCRISRINTNGKCYKGKKYLKMGMVQASRGCKFNCDFCSIKSLYPDGVRRKAVEDVVDEIKSIKEKLIFFIDDNLFYDEESACELFDALKPLKKKWACQISLEIAFRDELLTRMKDAGCIMVLIGFESLNPDNLKLMKKSANLAVKHYEDAIQNIYKHGIMIYGMFVFGYDYDTANAIKETYKFASDNHFCIANFNPLMLLPGTELYERYKTDRKIIYEKWWLDDNYHYGDAMHYPSSMTPEEMCDGCKAARYGFYAFGNVLKRLVNEKVNHSSLFNILVFLAINIISGVEVHRKQGEKLGDNGQ